MSEPEPDRVAGARASATASQGELDLQRPIRVAADRRAEPFAAASDELFPKGERKRLFDQLRHLSQWSRRALLVTGAAGSGKSTLCRHLQRALSANAAVATLQGTQCQNPDALYRLLAEQFGLDVGTGADSHRLSLLLREHLATQQTAERLCAVLLDDAQLASIGALEALLSLSADCRLRVLMFGDQTLSARVQEATVDLDIACHESLLLPLSEPDARSYIEWRARQLGYAQMPFNDEQLTQLVNLSDGFPGRIDALASEMLADLATRGSTRFDRPRKVFPIPHLWVTVGLLAVVGLLYLWIDSEPEPDAALAEAAFPQPLPERERPAILPASSSVPAASVSEESARIPASAAAVPRVEEAAPEVAAETSLSQPEPEAAMMDPVPPVAPPETIASTPTPGAVKRPAAKVSKPEPEAAKSEAEAAATAKRQIATPAPARAAPAKVAKSAPASISRVTGVRDSDWLLRRDGTHYTLQLLTLGSRDGMIRFLKAQRQPERFAVYERRLDGKALYVATYGSYSSRSAAEQASRRLPGSVGRIKPWIREFSAVQTTIRGQ